MVYLSGKTTEIDYLGEPKIDLKNKKILAVLSQNCRFKLAPSQVGKIVGLSKEVVHYRIKKLEKEGIIKGYYSVINTRKIGFQIFFVYIELQNISQTKENEIIDKLIKHPSTHYITCCFGKYDILFDILANSIDDFDKILREIFKEFGQYVKHYEISTLLDVLKYVALMESFSKGINLNKEKFQYDFTFMKDLENKKIDYTSGKFNLDGKDFQILYFLSNNSTLQLKQIARKINVSSDTVKYRIKRLIKHNLIIGFYPIINISMLGYHNYGLFLELNNIEFEEKKKILNYLALHPDAIFCLKSSGQYEITLNVAVKNNLHLYKLINDLRQRYPEQIKKIEIVLIIKDHKIAFLPMRKIKFTQQ